MHASVLIRSPQSFRVAILEGGYSGRYRVAVENFAAAARAFSASMESKRGS
jgi:hypothetical protein